ncbi:TIGR02587 family membrane protein [Microcoleus sp. FACHB-1515]|uniref:TIGR02587 family membrane protein n=1 Tax=Leptolyngbya sp. FACHB-1515 TaxID=2933931 RepID=UPI0016875379|nr:TIGR02587 family membrane protein [Microcoleus sp. FACHB-1515]
MSGKPAKLNSAWQSELNDLVRGSCGGFLFGIPLLYTMEVWWIGSFIEPPMMLAAIVTAFVAVFLLSRTAGFRHTQNIRMVDALKDTIEALAIGFVCTTIILVLLREVTPEVSLDEALGKVLFEGIPFSLGVALANLFLSSKDAANQNGQQDGVINATIADIGATAIGASIISASIAPTDEVAMLAAGISAPWLLALMAASLLISYGIVFQSGFANQDHRRQQRGLFQRPLSETVMSYLVSLLISAFLLWFFQQLQFDDPLSMWLRYTLILGLPATVGGAAGRLAV